MARIDKRPLKQVKCDMCWQYFSTTAPNAKICPDCRRPGSSGPNRKKK